MKNVLLVNPFGIGDVLFATPLIRTLKKRGASRVDVILGSRTAEIFDYFPYVDEIISIHKDELKRKPFWDAISALFRLLVKLRFRRYDTLIDLSLTREYSFWAAVLGVPRRVGFNFKNRGTFLTESISIPEGFAGKHVMEFYRDLASLLSISADDFRLEWQAKEDVRKRAFAKAEQAGLNVNQPYLIVAPGGGASWGKDALFKQWAPEKFSGLLLLLGGEWSVNNVVVIGTEAERPLAGRLLGTCSLNTFDLTGRLSLGETAALIQNSVCFVGNDGGLLHLAKAVGRPTISIFGPVDPVSYGPFPQAQTDAVIFKRDLECRPCYRKFRYKSDCQHRRCLTDLNVDEVMEQLRQKPILQILKSRSYEKAC